MSAINNAPTLSQILLKRQVVNVSWVGRRPTHNQLGLEGHGHFFQAVIVNQAVRTQPVRQSGVVARHGRHLALGGVVAVRQVTT